MELRQLRYFLKARELGNFTAAAEEIFISQSTLSQQIKQLEEELGIKLFNRIGKHISITEAGDIFAKYAQKSLRNAEEGAAAMQDLNQLTGGTLRIGVSYGLHSTLMPALKQLIVNYPLVKIDITFDTTSLLLERLDAMELDGVLSFQREAANPAYQYIPLFASPLMLVAAENTFSKPPQTISLQRISQLPLALPSEEFSTTHFVMAAFRDRGLQPDIRIQTNDIPNLLDIVRLGGIHSILTNVTVADQNLFTIPIQGKDMTRKAVLIHHKDIYKTAAMKVFEKALFEKGSGESNAEKG